MTNAIYFFQSFLSLNSFSSIGTTRGEIRLANALKKEARRLVTEAETEARNAPSAKQIAVGVAEKTVSRSFAEIALWHFQNALSKFSEAALRFKEAATIETKKQKEFSRYAKQMTERAAEAENSLGYLTEFLSRA